MKGKEERLGGAGRKGGEREKEKECLKRREDLNYASSTHGVEHHMLKGRQPLSALEREREADSEIHRLRHTSALMHY